MSNASCVSALAATPFTRLPHAVPDRYLPELSGAEFKLLTVLLRHTLGYQRDHADLSFSELSRLTGIRGRATIDKATAKLKQLGLFRVARAAGDGRRNRYTVIASAFADSSKSEPSMVQKVNHVLKKEKERPERSKKPQTPDSPETQSAGAGSISDSSAVALLVDFGLWPAAARDLIDNHDLTTDQIQTAIDALRTEIRGGAHVRNPAALLRSRLLNGWQPPQAEDRWPGETVELIPPAPEPVTDPIEFEAVSGPLSLTDFNSAAQSEWRKILPREAYDTYLGPVKLTDPEIADNRLASVTLEVPNPYACDWIQQRFKRLVQETLDRLAGTTVDITYHSPQRTLAA